MKNRRIMSGEVISEGGATPFEKRTHAPVADRHRGGATNIGRTVASTR